MEKYEELKQIFKGILTDLKLSEEHINAIMALVKKPQEMAKIVDAIEKNPDIKYPELFQVVLDSIEFEINIEN